VINTGVLAHGKSLEVVLFGGIKSMFQKGGGGRGGQERERETVLMQNSLTHGKSLQVLWVVKKGERRGAFIHSKG
jgi:hypothetical protein